MRSRGPRASARGENGVGQQLQTVKVVEVEPLQHHFLQPTRMESVELFDDLVRRSDDDAARPHLLARSPACAELLLYLCRPPAEDEPGHHRTAHAGRIAAAAPEEPVEAAVQLGPPGRGLERRIP